MRLKGLLLAGAAIPAFAGWQPATARPDVPFIVAQDQQDKKDERQDKKDQRRDQRQDQRQQKQDDRQQQRQERQQDQRQQQDQRRQQRPEQRQEQREERREDRPDQQRQQQQRQEQQQQEQQQQRQEQQKLDQQKQEQQRQNERQREDQRRRDGQRKEEEQRQQQQRQDGRQERREDRKEGRDERRDDRQDQRQDDGRQDRRDDRQEGRQDRREGRDDRREDRARRLDDVRGERRERREGNRVIIEEGNRSIIREGNRTIIRRDESDRFRRVGRDVDVRRIGGETRTVIVGPNGARIVTVTDNNGRLIRRSRLVDGREVIIIDNRVRGPRRAAGFFIDLPPPVIRIPRERYIVEADSAPPEYIYGALTAPPVEPIERAYTLDEIRYSADVRARMPRVDLDTITFETGSWEVTPDQYLRLKPVADGIARAVDQNPNEVFLIEGHTDAVGADEDNLSLSDRRAESVSVILTDEFKIPPENLTTQGYGEQQLKVPTDGPERANRRVTVRRITPLLQGQAQGGPGGPPRRQ